MIIHLGYAERRKFVFLTEYAGKAGLKPEDPASRRAHRSSSPATHAARSSSVSMRTPYYRQSSQKCWPATRPSPASAGPSRADVLAAHAPEQAWKRRSCGEGPKGLRLLDWAAASLPDSEGSAPLGWSRRPLVADAKQQGRARARLLLVLRLAGGSALPCACEPIRGDLFAWPVAAASLGTGNIWRGVACRGRRLWWEWRATSAQAPAASPGPVRRNMTWLVVSGGRTCIGGRGAHCRRSASPLGHKARTSVSVQIRLTSLASRSGGLNRNDLELGCEPFRDARRDSRSQKDLGSV
jgi:hypothetical protein